MPIPTHVQEKLLEADALVGLNSARAIKFFWLCCLEANDKGEITEPLAELGRRLQWSTRSAVGDAVARLREAGLLELVDAEVGTSRRRYRVKLPG